MVRYDRAPAPHDVELTMRKFLMAVGAVALVAFLAFCAFGAYLASALPH